MANVFKCGDISDIINKNQTKNEIKVKKKSKLKKKFNKMIEKNNKKLIKIDMRCEEDMNEVVYEDMNEDLDEDMDENDGQKDKKIESIEMKEKSIEMNKRTVFVGNLPKDITIKKLRQLFRKFGDIESIRLRGAVPMKEKMSKKVAVITKSFHSSKDNINAYVVFKSIDDISKAIEMNGYILDGHHIRVDGASDDKVYDNLRSIFVGNLPFITKEDQLFDLFKDCGDIEAVRVVRDSKTGVGKGFGFITFKSKDSVVLALERNEQTLNGRTIRVKRSKNDNKNTKQMKNIHKKPNINERKSNKFDPNPGFKGIMAKNVKKKINKKKGMNELKTKRERKKLSKIFSKP